MPYTDPTGTDWVNLTLALALTLVLVVGRWVCGLFRCTCVSTQSNSFTRVLYIGAGIGADGWYNDVWDERLVRLIRTLS